LWGFFVEVLKSPSHTTSSPSISETDSKPITDTEARQMVSDEFYNIDDFFIDIKNGEWVRFVFLTNDGRGSQILSISAKSPKNSAIIEILDSGNPVKMYGRFSRLKGF
jgi:hypothetical protein